MKELIEWTENYLISKFMLKSTSLKKIDNKIEFTLKEKTFSYIIMPFLNENINDNQAVVCLNDKKNLDYVIKNWNSLSSMKGLTIIFVNLERNDKWILNPYLHNIVADAKSLEKGLKSMFDYTNGAFVEEKIKKRSKRNDL